jgi:hypothetical protein
VCDPGQFRVLLIERGFHAVFPAGEFAFSLCVVCVMFGLMLD